MKRLLYTALTFTLVTVASTAAGETDEGRTKEVAPVLWTEHKTELLPNWLDLDAEYRVRSVFINPLELSGEDVRHVEWTEQRLRLDLGVKIPKFFAIHVQADVLAGTLFGDNGNIGTSVEPTSGIALGSKRPNRTGRAIGLRRPGADPLNSDSYVPQLKVTDPLGINWAYAEVNLPVGLLRIGRQPFTLGAGIGSHDGKRRNRWGVSSYADTADRLLFATKLDEIAKSISHGPGYVPDGSQDKGLFMVAAYDWTVLDDITSRADDLSQVMAGVLWREREADWFGLKWRKLVAMSMVLHKASDEFGTDVWAFPFRLKGHVGDLWTDLELTLVTGTTREIAEGYAAISGDEPADQDIFAVGAHASVAYQLGPVELLAEFNYASGDHDPRPSTSWHGFSYARDFNVGLLLYEHILAFESARSAAVGVEVLKGTGAEAYPVSEVASDGRYFNAISIFPQVTWQALKGGEHDLRLRLGALFAWPAAEGGLVDPVATMRAQDGEQIHDDAVNYHGGKPGSYYGTELDLQLSWTWKTFFCWTLEGAVLFPGSSLKDEHGQGVNSIFVENRFEFLF